MVTETRRPSTPAHFGVRVLDRRPGARDSSRVNIEKDEAPRRRLVHQVVSRHARVMTSVSPDAPVQVKPSDAS